MGALLAEARVILFSELLSARSTPPHHHINTLTPGAAVHAWSRFLLISGTPLLSSAWTWAPKQCALLMAYLSHLVSPNPWSIPTPSVTLQHITWPSPAPPTTPYPALYSVFLHSIRIGCPWQDALRIFSGLPDGHLSADGRVFATPALHSAPHTRLSPVQLGPEDDPDSLTLLFHGSLLIAITSSSTLHPRHTASPERPLVLSSRRPPFPTNFLPDYIRLKRTKAGLPIVPPRYVTSVVAAAGEWHARIGPLDAVTAAIVGGRLVMSKPRFPLRHSRRPNHSSWERNEAAKIALGPKFAAWIVQGIAEMVPRHCPLPLFIEPLGAVDKATDPWWRLILDARISNEYQDAWGVWYNSASALAALLDYCDIMFAEDLEDAYHLSAFAGCTGRLHWAPVLTFVEDGSMAWRWRLVLGCTPETCLGFCDKAMSGFEIDGFVGRFAAAHFGQRNAGSPLNALMRSILRFLARRGDPRPVKLIEPSHHTTSTHTVPPRSTAPLHATPTPAPPPPAAASAPRPCTAPSGWTTQSSPPKHPLTRRASDSLVTAPPAAHQDPRLTRPSHTGASSLASWDSDSATTSDNCQGSASLSPASPWTLSSVHSPSHTTRSSSSRLSSSPFSTVEKHPCPT